MNMEMVKRKLAKGLTTGVGVFASTYTGDLIENNSNLGNLGIAGTQMALGAGVAVASERLGDELNTRTGAEQGLAEVGVEHIGYGIHGAGFAEAAESLNAQQSGAMGRNPDRVVSVNANADGSSSTMMTSDEQPSLDTA
jgi:hypothetical protein